MTDRIEGVNPDRVVWCCKAAHLSETELFKQLKISPKTLARFLERKPALTFAQLQKIAKYFGRGVLFFMEPTQADARQVYTPQFRTITNQKPMLSLAVRTLIARAERQRDVLLAIQEELGEDKLEAWKTRLPSGARQGSYQGRALAIRQWLQLDGVKHWDDYRARVEAQGVMVIVSNGYNGSWKIPKNSLIRGFSLTHTICPLILINKQSYPAPQVFTLFHELAHLILHDDSFADEEEDLYSYRGKEAEANRLAGLVLLPDHLLDTIDVSAIRVDNPACIPEDLTKYRKRWGISAEVILRRLLDTGQIHPSVYQRFRAWSTANPPVRRINGKPKRHRHTEPLRIFGRRFVGTVLEAVSMDRITLNKASSYLDNIKIADLHKLETRCASR